MALLHVGALAAPLFVTWQAIVVTVVLYWLTGSIGVCLGYHRLLTHGAFANVTNPKALTVDHRTITISGVTVPYVAATPAGLLKWNT